MPHYLTKVLTNIPASGIPYVEGNPAELSVIKETLNDLNTLSSSIYNNQSIFLYPRGGGLDDGPNITQALIRAASERKTLVLSGNFIIDSSTHTNGLLSGIPSHTRLWCAPGTTFTSTLTSGGTYRVDVPFLAIWTDGSGVENTTLHIQSIIGAGYINTTSAITPNQWIMVGDATLSRCEIHKVISCVAGGGGFVCTLDRPVVLSNAAGQPVVPLADIPEDIILDFNGAILSGTGLQACVILAGRDCYIKGLIVNSSSGNLFDQYNGVHFNDGCYNCFALDCITDGMSIAGVFSGPHIANSESCSFINYRVSRLPSLGISFAGTISCKATDCQIDDCTGTGFYVSSLAGPVNNSRDNVFTRTLITRCGEGFGIDDGVRDTKIYELDCLNQATFGLHIYPNVIGVEVFGINTRNSGSYGARVDSDSLFYGWISDNAVTGSIIVSNGSKVTIDGFRWGMDSTSVPPFGAVQTGTGEMVLKNGKSKVNAAGGSATTYAAGASTFVRENVKTFGRGGHYSDAVNSMLIDHAGCDDSSCTVANVFGAGAQANYGTFVANGVAEITINYRNSRDGIVISTSLSTVGGVPAGSPYMSAKVNGTSFGMKAIAGDTSIYSWKDLSV